MFPKHFSIEKNFKNEDQNLSLFSKKVKNKILNGSRGKKNRKNNAKN